jgi:hypothetical protein
VAGALSSDTMGAREWLARMPKGFELDGVEDRVVRFGVPAPKAYSFQMMNDLWGVIGRLPPDHIKQERISSINKAELGPDVAGQYVPADQRIDIGAGTRRHSCSRSSATTMPSSSSYRRPSD